KATVEQGVQILRFVTSTESEPAFDISAFDVSWNSDATEILLTFKTGLHMEDHTQYYVGFKPNTVIKDKTGVARDSGYFKLTDGNYEDKYKFSILAFMTQALPAGSATPSPIYTPLPPAEKARDHYYFSYDDSASVAGVELTKHALAAGRMPDPAWARTWEFLNYEPFDHINQESASSGQFQVSLGLWKYNHPDNPYLANYEVGAHVTAPYLCKETRQALNLTVLVDISSSMNEKAGLASAESGEVPSKIALAKAGLHDLVDSLRPGDIIHLVEFSNKPFVQLDKFIVGSSPQQDYLAAVDKLSADGGTNLQAAIDAGYRQAQQLFDKNKLNRLLLITDAQPTEGITDIEKIKSMAALNNDAGIYLSALGMGHTHNQQLLNNMTEAGRGAYYTIQTRADIKEAMHDRFIPLMNVIARNVRFKLDFPGWMRHGKTAAEQVSADPSEVQPTNFSANTSQYFWEQFQANKTDFQPGQTVKLTISYDDPVSGNERSEIFEKRLDQMLDQDLNNIKAAHLIQLSTALIKHEITAREVDRELRELLPDTGK
ncbi:MAG TPA: VWA domain-containing protein, partial [Candidatus Obscuribacterales bacterium]